jgi:hypothetical protein
MELFIINYPKEQILPLKTGLTVSEEVERPPVLKDPF